MENETVIFFAAIIIAIGLWILYHKIFKVYYFNLSKALLWEVGSCFLAGYILASILVNLLGSVILLILKITIVGLLIALVLFLVWFILFLIFLLRHRLNPISKKVVPELEKTCEEQNRSVLEKTFWFAAHKIYSDRKFARVLLITIGIIIAYGILDSLFRS